MKPITGTLDFSFQRNEYHALAGILECAFILIITAIAIIAATLILANQVACPA